MIETITAPDLSILQPWASAILVGGKDVENRSFHTSYRGTVFRDVCKTYDHTSENLENAIATAGIILGNAMNAAKNDGSVKPDRQTKPTCGECKRPEGER